MELNLYFIHFKAELQCIYHISILNGYVNNFSNPFKHFSTFICNPEIVWSWMWWTVFQLSFSGFFNIRCCWMGRYIAIYCKGRRFFEKLDYCKYTVSQLFSFLWMWIDEHMQGQLYPFSIHKEIFISIKMGFLVMLVVVVREMKWCAM